MNHNSPIELPTRRNLSDWSPELIHSACSAAQADIYLLTDKEGREMILKDCARRWFPFRVLWAPFVLRREFRALQRLEGIEGVPRVYGWLDRYGFLMERLRAETMPKEKESRIEADFFDRLDLIVRQMHERGISHGDLRRKNILIDESQNAFLIDFATAMRRSSLFGRLVFKQVVVTDRLKVLKLKDSYLPGSLTPEERSRLDNPPFMLRLARLFKQGAYKPLKQRSWKKRWKKWRKRFARK